MLLFVLVMKTEGIIEALIVFATIFLAAFWGIPEIVNARSHAARDACIANLKQMDGAKASWALEQKSSPINSPSGSTPCNTNSLTNVTINAR